MRFGFLFEQPGGTVNKWVPSSVPVKNRPGHATADHVLNLCVDLRRRVRLVAHTNVIWLPKPAQQVAVDFGCRPAIEKRGNRQLANVASWSVAIRLPAKRTRGAGVVTGLGLKSGVGRGNRATGGRRGAPATS